MQIIRKALFVSLVMVLLFPDTGTAELGGLYIGDIRRDLDRMIYKESAYDAYLYEAKSRWISPLYGIDAQYANVTLYKQKTRVDELMDIEFCFVFEFKDRTIICAHSDYRTHGGFKVLTNIGKINDANRERYNEILDYNYAELGRFGYHYDPGKPPPPPMEMRHLSDWPMYKQMILDEMCGLLAEHRQYYYDNGASDDTVRFYFCDYDECSIEGDDYCDLTLIMESAGWTQYTDLVLMTAYNSVQYWHDMSYEEVDGYYRARVFDEETVYSSDIWE